MKSLFAALSLLAIASVPTASAWVGGPWSNNTHDSSSADGVYQGTLSGKNMIGIVYFEHDANYSSIAVQTSTSLIFFEGNLYQPNTVGYVNQIGREVTGILKNTVAGEEFDPTGYYRTTELQGGFFQAVLETYPVYTFRGKGELVFTAIDENGHREYNKLKPKKIPFRIRGGKL